MSDGSKWRHLNGDLFCFKSMNPNVWCLNWRADYSSVAVLTTQPFRFEATTLLGLGEEAAAEHEGVLRRLLEFHLLLLTDKENVPCPSPDVPFLCIPYF